MDKDRNSSHETKKDLCHTEGTMSTLFFSIFQAFLTVGMLMLMLMMLMMTLKEKESSLMFVMCCFLPSDKKVFLQYTTVLCSHRTPHPINVKCYQPDFFSRVSA